MTNHNSVAPVTAPLPASDREEMSEDLTQWQRQWRTEQEARQHVTFIRSQSSERLRRSVRYSPDKHVRMICYGELVRRRKDQA